MTLPLLASQNASPAPASSADAARAAIAAVQTALGDLPVQSSPGLSVIAALKNAWSKIRAAAVDINHTQGGRATGEWLSESADALLGMLLKFAAARAGLASVATAATPSLSPPYQGGEITGVALLAMGSYGRCELAPYSDIDILLLYAEGTPQAKLETTVGTFLRPLWDCGLNAGHSVRTPQECLAAMDEMAAVANASETATALLEARFVAGDQPFADRFFKGELPDFFRRRGRQFVDAKFEETIKRWRGLTVYHTQPNLKDSPGALRDFQVAMWIDKASQLSEHLPRLKDRPLVSKTAIDEALAGYERLLTFRCALHSLCGRKQDVLDFQMQQAVAADLAYEDADDLKAAERLLRDYFKAATAVHRLAHTVTRRYLEERAVATRDIERLRRRPVDEDFTRVGEYLYATREDLLQAAEWIEPAMRAFLHAARQGIAISQDLAEAIRTRVPEMTDKLRAHPEAALHFRHLMHQRSHVAATLRSMRDTGFLGSYIPEFGELEGLVINDVFHDYTVDEHTLFVVEAVDRLYESVAPHDQFRRGVLEGLPRTPVLRLACLFHDLGKSRGAPGHSERGALMLPQIGERLHLRNEEVRVLIALVQHHLLLSRISQRRDPGEGSVLRQLAEKVGSKTRLDLLYLLTYCDAISVGSGAYPLWKDALLQELYVAAAQILESGGAAPAGARIPGVGAPETEADVEPAAGAIEAALLKWAGSDEDRELALEHCRRVPRRYLVEVTPDEAVSHLELLKRMRSSGREAVALARGSGNLVDMWVVSTDRPKRFSQICGAFLGAGVSVVSAIAYTRDDSLILDQFRVAPGLDMPAPDEAFWKKMAAVVEEALTGSRRDFLARIDSARKRIPRQPPISRRIEPEIRVDNKLSERFTVVDVVCGDRIGLLYGLSRALGDLSCDIHFAKIDTNQGLVIDVFYITEVGGGQVVDPEKQLNIKRLLKAVAADFQEARR